MPTEEEVLELARSGGPIVDELGLSSYAFQYDRMKDFLSLMSSIPAEHNTLITVNDMVELSSSYAWLTVAGGGLRVAASIFEERLDAFRKSFNKLIELGQAAAPPACTPSATA